MKVIFKKAFKKTMPVLFGYLFLSSAIGLLFYNAGYNVIWAFFAGLFVYAGSGEMLLVSLLTCGAPLATIAFLTLLINSRHAFYGLSFIERFKNTKKAYPYMIFALTDETYSILCSIPERNNKEEDGKVMFAAAFLDHVYWMCGAVLGSLLGQTLSFNWTGVDFAMTALFVVIFIEQWKSFKSHLPVFIGIGSSIVCVSAFGSSNFILPSLIITVSLLMIFKNKICIKNEGKLQEAS
ncbi:MAG: AzlC family ABC transporter permease [Clostridia bacterium]|jgi:4-azaleucine resistance transporter AzlC|nr:AzlC family ABC transporter permease [Clostridia bacterium]